MTPFPKRPARGALKAPKAVNRERFRLNNGLEIVFVQDRRFPLLTASLAVRGGSASVPAEDAGLADACARLLTEGTRKRGAKDVAEKAESFGGDIEAFATKDHIIIDAFALAEHARGMFDLLAEVALRPAFPSKEIAIRKRNMLDELRLLRGRADALASVAFHEGVFGGHPYGVVSATEDSISRITGARLKRLHERLFFPGNASLVVVGDITQGRLRRELRRSFASWRPVDAPPVPPPPPPDPVPEGGRRIILRDRPGSVQAALRLGGLALTERHPRHYPLLVANMVLGGLISSRLWVDLREMKGYTYSVESSLDAHRMAGTFLVKTQVRTEVTREALEAVLGHLRRMREELVTGDELKAAKNVLIGEFARALATQEGVARLVRHELLHGLPPDHLDAFAKNILGVTAAQARRAAREYMDPDRMLIVLVGKARAIEKNLGGLLGWPILRGGPAREKTRPRRISRQV
ncbi:MAG: pitrilysin family protein [Elusimicrobiota bacterium]